MQLNHVEAVLQLVGESQLKLSTEHVQDSLAHEAQVLLRGAAGFALGRRTLCGLQAAHLLGALHKLSLKTAELTSRTHAAVGTPHQPALLGSPPHSESARKKHVLAEQVRSVGLPSPDVALRATRPAAYAVAALRGRRLRSMWALLYPTYTARDAPTTRAASSTPDAPA